MTSSMDVLFRGVLGSSFEWAQAGFALLKGREVNSKSIGLSVDRDRPYILRKGVRELCLMTVLFKDTRALRQIGICCSTSIEVQVSFDSELCWTWSIEQSNSWGYDVLLFRITSVWGIVQRKSSRWSFKKGKVDDDQTFTGKSNMTLPPEYYTSAYNASITWTRLA